MLRLKICWTDPGWRNLSTRPSSLSLCPRSGTSSCPCSVPPTWTWGMPCWRTRQPRLTCLWLYYLALVRPGLISRWAYFNSFATLKISFLRNKLRWKSFLIPTWPSCVVDKVSVHAICRCWYSADTLVKVFWEALITRYLSCSEEQSWLWKWFILMNICMIITVLFSPIISSR